jgi:predicted RNase H-like HicB family nuclease
MKKQTIVRKKNFFKVEIAVVISKEYDLYVAYSPALELSSYGDSEKEAMEAFDDALAIFIEETTKNSTLEKVLLRLGWILQQVPKVEYRPPQLSEEELFRWMKSGAQNIVREQIALPY